MAVVSIWAILLSVASTMGVGMLWYGPLFGKRWMAAMGWDTKSEAELEEMRKSGGPGYALSMAGAVVTALVVSMLYDWSAPVGTLEGPLLGAMIALVGWAAFYVPPAAVNHFFEGRSGVLTGISVGHFLVQQVLIGVWVGLFA